VPRGTVLDSWSGRTFVSLVGFRFTDTAVLGVHIPWHRDFTEVNLRFYVRVDAGGELRRGVVFIQEIVPHPAIAAIARVAYNERYVYRPMRFSLGVNGAAYRWFDGASWCELSAESDGAFALPAPGSQEEFITEHFWGYVQKLDSSTGQYKVEHPSWAVAAARTHGFRADVARNYGEQFVPTLAQRPASAFFARGSEVSVFPIG
jgi:uncharacterized protein YqjF (DUF2071 family)